MLHSHIAGLAVDGVTVHQRVLKQQHDGASTSSDMLEHEAESLEHAGLGIQLGDMVLVD